MEIGIKLRQFREESHLSQKEIAEKLEVAVATYNSWESDLTEPKISHLIRLAKIHNKDITDFLTDAIQKKQTVSNTNNKDTSVNGFEIHIHNNKLIQHLESQISDLKVQLKDKDEIIALLKDKIM
jgi:transcriptional regulator with XRE-family HTH domain